MSDTKLTEDQVRDITEGLGVLLGSYITRRMLRRYGATKLQAFTIASALTSLALLNRRLETLNKTIKESR